MRERLLPPTTLTPARATNYQAVLPSQGVKGGRLLLLLLVLLMLTLVLLPGWMINDVFQGSVTIDRLTGMLLVFWGRLAFVFLLTRVLELIALREKECSILSSQATQ